MKHYEKYHREGRIVPIAQHSAGGLAIGAIKCINFLYQGISEGVSRSWIRELRTRKGLQWQ